jgi:hypothetical protein
LPDSLLALGRREAIGGAVCGSGDALGGFVLVVIHGPAENGGVRRGRTGEDGHDDFPGRVGSAFVLRGEPGLVGSDEPDSADTVTYSSAIGVTR